MSRESLILALAKHADKELTPAVARAILDDLYPDRSIDPRQFEPVEYGDYWIAVESFRDILHELKPLHRAHWAETEMHRHRLALNPDYAAIGERERAGRALQFTVRHRDELVGQLQMYLMESEHTQTPLSEENTLFIRPDHRGGMLAVRLVRYAKDVLVRLRGDHLIYANSKTANRADVLLRRVGFEHFANQMCMFATADPPTGQAREGAACVPMTQENDHVL